jgi:hypothetical protein
MTHPHDEASVMSNLVNDALYCLVVSATVAIEIDVAVVDALRPPQ